jgi:predicted amidohydrolase
MIPTVMAAADMKVNARFKEQPPLLGFVRTAIAALIVYVLQEQDVRLPSPFRSFIGADMRPLKPLAWPAASRQEEAPYAAEHFSVMSTTIVAAAIQLAAHDRDHFVQGWRAAALGIRKAHALGAQIAVLPEGTLPAYVLGYRPLDESETAHALDECRSIARETAMVIVVGAARRDGGRVFNSAVVIDADGSIAGTADKQFLWHFDRQWFSAGERIGTIETSIGTIGALVCADGRIPTIARALADGGAQLLVMPTAWVTSGRDPAQLENIQADLFARVRAKENGVPFVAANKSGVERGCVAYCGKSQIVDAAGTVVAIAPQTGEAVITREVTMARRPARQAVTPCNATPSSHTAVRVAVSAHDWVHLPEERLRILQASAFIAPGLVSGIEAVTVDDAQMLDPGFLVPRRLAGFDVVVWQTRHPQPWQSAFARTRAIELRMYVVVLDLECARAYVVDPDGSVICGTFEGYAIAGFSYDPQCTDRMLVAPGTDVREGLQRALADGAR